MDPSSHELIPIQPENRKKNSVMAETETVENVDNKTDNDGLASHKKRPKSSDERKEERRFLRKIDLTILPLLGIVYFLASMASPIPYPEYGVHSKESISNDETSGPWRHQQCRCCWHDLRLGSISADALPLRRIVLRGIHPLHVPGRDLHAQNHSAATARLGSDVLGHFYRFVGSSGCCRLLIPR